MTEQTVTDESWSLADLGNMDTSEIKELKSRMPIAGLWLVLVTGVSLGEQEGNPEKNTVRQPFVSWKMESLAIKPLKNDPDLDMDSLVGRRLSDRQTMWRNNMKDELGYLKGRYKKVGIPNAEPKALGGLMEQDGAPGWLDNAVLEQIPFIIKVQHKSKNGDEVATLEWLAPGTDWEKLTQPVA